MQKIVLLAVLLFSGRLAFAQSPCDRTIVLKCGKGLELKNGIPGDEIPFEHCSLTIGGGKMLLTATMGGQTESVHGEITEVQVCSWKELLKNGKAVYKANIHKSGSSEQSEVGIIDIQSDNNYTVVTLSSDPDKGSKLRLVVTEYTIEEAPAPEKQEQPEEQPRPKKRKRSR